ncbi:MAG: hypothetical protein ACAH83_04310 [Alphaproteobacteria bacterium]
MAVEQASRPEYQNVAFFTQTMPDYFDEKNPGASAIRLAGEKFGFADADFNPKHTGRFYGQGKYGYTFEVQIKFTLAQVLASKQHPDILNIFE